MVQRRQQGPAVLHHAEHPAAQTLVVVHDVELVTALGQQLAGPERVRQRLPEAGRTHDAELDPVLTRVELPGVGHPERIGVAVEVEARAPG